MSTYKVSKREKSKKGLLSHGYLSCFVNLRVSQKEVPFLCSDICFVSQKTALHKAFLPSPQRWWTSFILSEDLQIPLQLQSNEATHTLPASAFHSQSALTSNILNFKVLPYEQHFHSIFSFLSFSFLFFFSFIFFF